jgi:hypothetical protein
VTISFSRRTLRQELVSLLVCYSVILGHFWDHVRYGVNEREMKEREEKLK